MRTRVVNKDSDVESYPLVLQNVIQQLDTIIKEQYGGVAFVKLQDMSPKDSTLIPDRVTALYDELQKTLPPYSNRNLQSYVLARQRALCVHSASEALSLIATSERIETEMMIHLDMGEVPEQVSFLIRAWEKDFDPAYEYRGFIGPSGDLTGLSQMATHDVLLHYPQAAEHRDQSL